MLRYSGLTASLSDDEVRFRSAASPGAFTYVTSSAPVAISAPLSALIAKIEESCSEISPRTCTSRFVGSSPASAVAICAIFSTSGSDGRISS